MGDGNRQLKVKVINLQRNTASLLKLLGGSDDDRLRFWEIVKGITTPAVYRVVGSQVDAVSQQLKTAQSTLKALERNAKALSN